MKKNLNLTYKQIAIPKNLMEYTIKHIFAREIRMGLGVWGVVGIK